VIAGSINRTIAICGFALLVVAPLVMRLTGDFGGAARVIGVAGFALLALAGLNHAWLLYRGGPKADLPTAIGRHRVLVDRSLRTRMVVTVVLAIGLPAAAAVALLAALDPGWLLLWLVLVFAGAGWAVERRAARSQERASVDNLPAAQVLLERLCMQADLPVPGLVVTSDVVATAWTSGGRIHVTAALLDMLDDAELEAVLAHELAHLAHRDAAVMDISTSPSRGLLGGVAVLLHPSRLPSIDWRGRVGFVFMSIFYIPPALLLGWISRLGVLGLSRARELSADAAAATLTGRPSALASALLKLDSPQSGIPRADLRLMDVRGALSIIEIDPSRFGRLLHTHPPVATRVERLQEMEAELQRGDVR
jgi:heat shock protein HtpX